MKIIKSSRHQKIIGNFGEHLICNWLSRSGFEVILVDHIGIDIIASRPQSQKRSQKPSKKLIGITVKSRTRDFGKEDEAIRLFDLRKRNGKNDRQKLLDACNTFDCEPWIAVYVEASYTADVYLTSLENYDNRYRDKKEKTEDTWRVRKKYKEQYKKDHNVKHIHIIFVFEDWNWNWKS